MSGRAGPVIKTIGIRIKRIEKKTISIDNVLFVNNDLKGKIINFCITFNRCFIEKYSKKAKKNAVNVTAFY